MSTNVPATLATTHDDVFMAGRWQPAHGTGRTQVRNPATEDVWAEVPDCDEVDVDTAVGAARSALPAWELLPAAGRAEHLLRLADEIDRRASELSAVITTENGTPVVESRTAPSHGATHLRLTAGLAAHIDGEDRRENPMAAGASLVRRRPAGVAGLITPWNFPLGLLLIKLGPALLAGCSVVAKPAPETPMATRLLMEAVTAAGIPPGVVNLVTGGTRAGAALVEHPGVDKISFTGSTDVGRVIGATCGQRLRPVTLELGGKSPAIVLDDADLEVLAAHLLRVTMRNTGQTCKACTRLLVPAHRQDEIVDLVTEVIASAQVGDPVDPETVFGPLVSARQRERVLGYIDVGRAEGARVALGGGRVPSQDRGYFVEPTVLRDVEPDMRVAREEIFGPVLAVLPYDGIEDAVRIANDSSFGLAATVFGRDVERALAVAERLETGNVGINHYGSNAAAPFGGHKDSGLGTEFGPEGLDAYLKFTSIHLPG